MGAGGRKRSMTMRRPLLVAMALNALAACSSGQGPADDDPIGDAGPAVQGGSGGAATAVEGLDAGINLSSDAGVGSDVGNPNGRTDAQSQPDAASAAQNPPTNRKELMAWLAKKHYLSWRCESQVMNARPNGAHGRNRVCSNNLASTASAGPYPVGAASVKELYAGNQVVEYAVSVKVKSEGKATDWYWFEGNTEGLGISGCAGCHSQASSYGGRDYVYIQVR